MKLSRILAFTLVFSMLLSVLSIGLASSKEVQWAVDNGLNLDESMDELYEKALIEGKLVIYTISSRTQKVATAFMEEYPGITVDVKDVSASTLKEQFVTEYEAGIRNVDILHSKELTGEYLNEIFPEGWLHNYQPESIFGKVDKTYMALTPLLTELNIWFYNTEEQDTAPFTSWWDLTTEDWRGRVVFQDPVSNIAYAALLTAMVEHEDEMAADYEAVFGKPIELANDEPTAAHAWIKRFLANAPIIAKGSDEVIELVGAAGQKNPPVGYASSVKLRKAQESGYKVGATPETLHVSNGIPALNFIGVANEATHPNAAKLFIKYWMGGVDGQGKGYSFLVSPGTWSMRPENPTSPDNEKLSNIPLWPANFDYIYNNILDVEDYWLLNR